MCAPGSADHLVEVPVDEPEPLGRQARPTVDVLERRPCSGEEASEAAAVVAVLGADPAQLGSSDPVAPAMLVDAHEDAKVPLRPLALDRLPMRALLRQAIHRLLDPPERRPELAQLRADRRRGDRALALVLSTEASWHRLLRQERNVIVMTSRRGCHSLYAGFCIPHSSPVVFRGGGGMTSTEQIEGHEPGTAGEESRPVSRTRHHRIVVVGGGTAGMAVAARLCRKLKEPDLAIVEPSQYHYFQPQWTLVGGGVVPKEQSRRTQKSVTPRKAVWIRKPRRRSTPTTTRSCSPAATGSATTTSSSRPASSSTGRRCEG